MSEFRLNERRNWKAQTFPYDHFIPDASRECSYCLTELQAEILRGIIEPLAWSTRWWSDTGAVIDTDAITAFRDDTIRRLLMGCCGDEVPVQFRYTGDGVLQRSTDGGVTFEDAPEYDPRNYSPRFPPLAGSDGTSKKCAAATGAAMLIQEQVGDQLTDDMTRYTLGQLITDWVKTLIETSNPFLGLVTVITNQIFALVISVLRPALTSTVYDTLKCIIYCHMGDDASVTEDQWAGIRQDITDMIGGIAGIFLEHLIYLLGVAGTNNLIRSGAASDGDCSACACDCNDCPSTEEHGFWEFYTPSAGVTLLNLVGYSGQYGLFGLDGSVTIDLGADICVSALEISQAWAGGGLWSVTLDGVEILGGAAGGFGGGVPNPDRHYDTIPVRKGSVIVITPMDAGGMYLRDIRVFKCVEV